MSKRHFKLTIGDHQFEGLPVLLIGAVLLIPILFLIGVLLLFVFRFLGIILGGSFNFIGGILGLIGGIFKLVFSLVRFIFSFSFGILGLALIFALIVLFLPTQYRNRLTSHLHSKKKSDTVEKSTPSNSKSSPDSFVDVDFTPTDDPFSRFSNEPSPFDKDSDK